MGKLLLALAMAAMGLAGADLAGKWTGTIKLVNDQGEPETKTAYLVLQQDGDKVTGTAGPDAGEQYAIQAGKVDNGHFTFQIPEHSMKFDLVPSADEMTGEITREEDGKIEKAKISVKREKQ